MTTLEIESEAARIERKQLKKEKKEKKRLREQNDDAELVEDAPSAKKSKKEKKSKKSKSIDSLPIASETEAEETTVCPSPSSSAEDDELSASKTNSFDNNTTAISESNKAETTSSIRAEHNIRVYSVVKQGHMERRVELKDETTFKPYSTFDACGEYFPKTLVDTLASKFEKPSPIQMQAWPIALSGSNLVGIAETGSGKTLGFLLPGMVPSMNDVHKNIWAARAPKVLVLAPTRELVGQIHAEAVKFAANQAGTPLRCVQLVGGMPKGPQIRELKWGCDVLIATPGRLLDLHQMKFSTGLDLSQVDYFVLDEADRMLDMGFEQPLKEINALLTCGSVQRLMFSATWPKEIQKLARTILGDAQDRKLTQLFIGENVEEGNLKANKKVSQDVFVMNSFEGKKDKLRAILDEHAVAPEGKSKFDKPKIVIFGRTKRGVDELAKTIEYEMGHWPLSIHGDKEQRERDWALNEFKKVGSSEYNILVATDVAARGIDVKGVRAVINFDFPMQIEDYVHRIGRTGRGGESGKSFSFFQERDCTNPGKMARQLMEILREAEQPVPEDLRKIGGTKGGGKGFGKGKGKGKGFGKRRW